MNLISGPSPSGPCSSSEDVDDIQRPGSRPVAPHSRWRRDALHPPQVQRGAARQATRGCFPADGLRCTTWNTRGLVGSVFSPQRNRERKHDYFRKLLVSNNILCLQEVHEKDEFLQALHVLAPRFLFFGTFIPGNENTGGSAICIHKDLLPDEATVTHIVTCLGRVHIVSIQSERTKLVIVNVHFEPERTVRRLRERLRLIVPHWPSYPNAVGLILGDFNICDPFNVVNQSFTDGDTGKTAALHCNFPNILEIVQPDHTRRDSSVGGIIRTLSRIDRIFVNMPMAEVRDFHCYSNVFEQLGNRTIPSDHTAVRLVIQKPDNQGRQIKRIPAWMPRHPVFRSFLKRLHDGHRYFDEFFRALDEFKTIYEQAKKQTFRDIERKTPDCASAKLVIASTALRAYRKRHLKA